MPTDLFRYDPETDTVYTVVGDEEQVFTGKVNTLLGGQYTLIGATLRDAKGRIVTNIGRQGPTYISRYTNAAGNPVTTLSSGIARETLAGDTFRMAQYHVSGEVTVMASSGKEYSINVEKATSSGIGQRLIVYKNFEGNEVFANVKQGSEQEAEIRRIFGDQAYWATARQASERAIIGYLKRNHEVEIEDIVNEGGMMDEFGSLQTTFSGVIEALARINFASLNYTKAIFFNKTGEIGNPYAP